MSGSRTKAWAMLTPNGLEVSRRMAFTSSRITSRSPDEVSIIPSPPALLTAEASCERAIQPIGACTMGYSTPSIWVMRLRIMGSPDVAPTYRNPLASMQAGFKDAVFSYRSPPPLFLVWLFLIRRVPVDILGNRRVIEHGDQPHAADGVADQRRNQEAHSHRRPRSRYR